MSQDAFDLADVIQDDAEMLNGTISLENDFSLDCTHYSKKGDLFSSGFNVTSDFGGGSCMLLGKEHYLAISEQYQFKEGIICNTDFDQSLFGLFFQLKGAALTVQPSRHMKMDIAPGKANLLIVPPMHETFELQEISGGETFSVWLSKRYLTDLATRYPELLGPSLQKIKRGELCMLSERHVSITPRMYSVIHRIQHYSEGHITGSLFLEAQVLNLLSLLFNEIKQPESNKRDGLSKTDVDRMHRAKEILTEQISQPPTLAELSKKVGSNEFKLKQGFKKVFGSSPYAYHLQHKMELARSYILDTELSISEIAYKVGYSDPSHFTNAFRKQFGQPPSALRG